MATSCEIATSRVTTVPAPAFTKLNDDTSQHFRNTSAPHFSCECVRTVLRVFAPAPPWASAGRMTLGIDAAGVTDDGSIASVATIVSASAIVKLASMIAKSATGRASAAHRRSTRDSFGACGTERVPHGFRKKLRRNRWREHHSGAGDNWTPPTLIVGDWREDP